jgi:hypothetical protein
MQSEAFRAEEECKSEADDCFRWVVFADPNLGLSEKDAEKFSPYKLGLHKYNK